MPGYNSAIIQLNSPRIETTLPPMLGESNTYLVSGTLPGSEVLVYLIYAPKLYARHGGLYQDAASQDWEDNPRRFSYLAHVATFIAAGHLAGWRPDVVHANDWHAGLVPLFLAMEVQPRPPTVFTVHNLAFQGNFPRSAMEQAGVPAQLFKPDGVEFYGHFSFLKAALRYADKITTVSPTYCREILGPSLGCGFDGLLRSREQDLTGILNGIDENSWNPATDAALIEQFSQADISGKRACKSDALKALGFESSSHPLLAFTSRVTRQKMASILVDAIPHMLAMGAKVAICGDGDPAIRKSLLQLAAYFPQQVAIRPYSETLAHRLVGGADILLAPARFEPCGLTQIYGSRYGTLPVVRRTGGLADTVTDATRATIMNSSATGFAFDEISRDGLLSGVSRALAAWHEPLIWQRMQKTAMGRDFGWESSAAKYVSVYKDALKAASLRRSFVDARSNSCLPRLAQAGVTMTLPEDQIRNRSYEIWQREGCPNGLADQHWFQAIAELKAEFGNKNADPASGRGRIVWPRPRIPHPPRKIVQIQRYSSAL